MSQSSINLEQVMIKQLVVIKCDMDQALKDPEQAIRKSSISQYQVTNKDQQVMNKEFQGLGKGLVINI